MEDGPSFLNRKEKAFFKCAEEMSKLSDHRCQIGCVVVDHHRLISSGHNSDSKMNRLQKNLDTRFFNVSCEGKLHAETMALLPFIKSKTDLSHATLYTFRRNKLGELAKSRPCPRCMQLIKSLGIKKLVYTTEDGICRERLY